MTKDELIAEIRDIRDLLGKVPEIGSLQRGGVPTDKMEAYFNHCDHANDSIHEAYGRLDELTCVDIETGAEREETLP